MSFAAYDQEGIFMQELQEKDFINESYTKNPRPFWFWLAVILTITALIWAGQAWYSSRMAADYAKDPFLEVTNREFSVFLWQFPERMRINAPRKNGYLTGFQYENKVSLVLDEAEDWVVAPPELLFLYHTWKRQISRELSPRAIPSAEFKDFLNYVEEWKPLNWKQAPNGYVELIDHLYGKNSFQDLAELPLETLPMQVRQAFQGWKNFFTEGEAINALTPSYREVRAFLKKHPHYARNYWRNIVEASVPDYLRFSSAHSDDTIVPRSELANFLQVALFNYLTMTKPSS